MDDKDYVDLCCRSLHKCDAYKRIELNQTTEWSFRHCECMHSFQICLKNLNTSLSNEVAFIHSINATKCYSKDHPIIKCIKFETYSESNAQLFTFMNLTEREKYFRRCLKYELDESQPEHFQIFDMPFNNHANSSFGMLFTKTHYCCDMF